MKISHTVTKLWVIQELFGGKSSKDGEHSGSVVECLSQDRGGRRFKSHQRHCVVVLEQDTFILA